MPEAIPHTARMNKMVPNFQYPVAGRPQSTNIIDQRGQPPATYQGGPIVGGGLQPPGATFGSAFAQRMPPLPSPLAPRSSPATLSPLANPAPPLGPGGIAQPDQFTPDPGMVSRLNAWRGRAYGPMPPVARGPFQPAVAENRENQGLADAVNQMHAINQQIAARGPVPYQPTPVSPGQPAPSPYSPGMQSLVNRGLNNARFGNARESLVYDISHPGTGYRPPLEPQGGMVQQAPAVNPAEFAKRQGLEFNPQTGVLAGNSPAANMTPKQLGDLRSTGRSPFDPNRPSSSQLAINLQNTKDARAATAKERAGLPSAAQQRAAIRQTEFQNQLAAAAPEQYQNRLALEAQQHGIRARNQDTLASNERVADINARAKNGLEPNAPTTATAAAKPPINSLAGTKLKPEDHNELQGMWASNHSTSEVVNWLHGHGITDKTTVLRVIGELTGSDPGKAVPGAVAVGGTRPGQFSQPAASLGEFVPGPIQTPADATPNPLAPAKPSDSVQEKRRRLPGGLRRDTSPLNRFG